jgi:hypothetical protein
MSTLTINDDSTVTPSAAPSDWLKACLTRWSGPIAASSTFDVCSVVTPLLLFLYAGSAWPLMERETGT